jgi:hypothetical protein
MFGFHQRILILVNFFFWCIKGRVENRLSDVCIYYPSIIIVNVFWICFHCRFHSNFLPITIAFVHFNIIFIAISTAHVRHLVHRLQSPYQLFFTYIETVSHVKNLRYSSTNHRNDAYNTMWYVITMIYDPAQSGGSSEN